jgi:signal transduction histidine kinase
VREAVSNAARYAKVTKLTGSGLNNLRQRAQEVDGSFTMALSR